MLDSLQVTDQQSAEVAVAERVTLANINSAIKSEFTFTADQTGPLQSSTPELKILTICLIVMKNGFTIIGKSAPASSDNFNAELGVKFAREDAIRQLWPLMGFALREKLSI